MRIARVAFVATVLVAVLPGNASANNWAGATGNTGCTSTLNMADNETHTVWYYDSLRADGRQATNRARNHDLDPTAINTIDATSDSSIIDAVIFSQYYTTFCGLDWSGGIAGFTMCVSTNSQDRCERHEIRYNELALDNLNDDRDQSLACHELGHSVGLKHRQVEGAAGNGCMDNDHFYPDYTDHDRSHLSDHY
jgi:hypothetical protein